MTDWQDDDLLQEYLDGALTPESDPRLAALLQTPAGRERLARARAVNEMLEAPADTAAPPPRFVDDVMDAITAAPSPGTIRRKITWGGTRGLHAREEASMRNRKTLLWSLAAAAAVVLVVFALTGFPRVDRGADATIGAAARYQAQQMSARDVKLGDAAAQQFMQSEVFDQLVRDPNARKLFGNQAFRELMGDGSVRAIFDDAALAASLRRYVGADASVHAALTDQALLAALASKEVRAGLRDEVALRALTSDAFIAALQSPLGKKAFADEAFLRAAIDRSLAANLSAELSAAYQDAAIRRALDDPMIRAALSNRNFIVAAGKADLVNNLSAVRPVLLSANFAAMLADRQMDAAFDSQAFMSMLAARKLAAFHNDAALRAMIAGAEFDAMLASGVLTRSLQQAGFEAALRSPRFVEAMAIAH